MSTAELLKGAAFIEGTDAAQITKDAAAAFKAKPRGIVVLRACLPKDATQGATMHAWKTYAKYRGMKGYHALLLDIDGGLGVIRKAKKGERANVRKIGKAPWEPVWADRVKSLGIAAKEDAAEALEGWL